MNKDNIWTSEQKPNAQCPYSGLNHLNLLQDTQGNQPNGHQAIIYYLGLSFVPAEPKRNHPIIYICTLSSIQAINVATIIQVNCPAP